MQQFSRMNNFGAYLALLGCLFFAFYAPTNNIWFITVGVTLGIAGYIIAWLTYPKSETELKVKVPSAKSINRIH